MTPFAPQRAALEEHNESLTGTIHRGVAGHAQNANNAPVSAHTETLQVRYCPDRLFASYSVSSPFTIFV